MQLNRRIPVLALLGGLIGAGLRAVQLLTAFERSTGLYISENPCGKLLLGWLLYCFLGLMSSRDNWEPILWFLRMFGTIAPAAGCALAWTARKTRRGGRKGGYLS